MSVAPIGMDVSDKSQISQGIIYAFGFIELIVVPIYFQRIRRNLSGQ